MTWVKRFIVFLVVGFSLFYLVSQPVAAANAVRAVAGGLAVVFGRSSSSFRLWLVSGGVLNRLDAHVESQGITPGSS